MTEERLLIQTVSPHQGWFSNAFAKIMFRLDGLHYWMSQERGPDPDYSEDMRDLHELVRHLRRKPQEPTVHYTEGGGSNSWQKWILGILGLMAVSGVGGVIGMYGRLTAIEAKMDSLQGQFTNLQRLVEPRYRGSPE